MSMGKRQAARQESMWIPTDEVSRSPGHPFYERLNALLSQHGFDAFVERLCRPYYAERTGGPAFPPGCTSGCC
jgi:transposase